MTSVLQELLQSRATGVRKAAAALDILVPDWATRVDVERLEMISHRDCVLGQVFHAEPYAYHYGKLRLLEVDTTIYSPVFACEEFRAEWCTAIAARLTPEPPVVTWTHRERRAQIKRIAYTATAAAVCLAVYLF